MNAIVYISPRCRPQKEFISVIEKAMASIKTRLFDQIDDILEQFARPAATNILAVLLINDLEEMSRLLALTTFSMDRSLLLILPDRNRETLDLAYRLFPRYTCTIYDHPGELLSVIKKLIENRSDLEGVR